MGAEEARAPENQDAERLRASGSEAVECRIGA